MVPTVRVGTVLIEDDWPAVTNVLTFASDPYGGNWSVLRTVDGFALDRAIHAAGWNFLFVADELKSTFFGRVGTQRIQSALKRILTKVQRKNFNCLEVTGIVSKTFLGIPYVTVFAHSRHIQKGYRLHDDDQRRATRDAANWSRV